MRLIHCGQPNELLQIDGEEIAAGQEFERDDDRAAQLLADSSLPIRPASEEEWGRAASFDSGGVVDSAGLAAILGSESLITPDQAAAIDAATSSTLPAGEPDTAPAADTETQREASTGEAQQTEGDNA